MSAAFYILRSVSLYLATTTTPYHNLFISTHTKSSLHGNPPTPAFNPPLFSTFPHTAMRTHSRVTCQATHEEFAFVHLCSKPRLTRQQFKLVPTVDYLNTPTSPVTEKNTQHGLSPILCLLKCTPEEFFTYKFTYIMQIHLCVHVTIIYIQTQKHQISRIRSQCSKRTSYSPDGKEAFRAWYSTLS